MNKRGFLATLAAMCVAPFAAKAKATPPPFDPGQRMRFKEAWLKDIDKSSEVSA